MDFIKRHYEKVILLGLFLIFIGLMFLVQSVISSTQEVKESDLRLPPRQPDYVNEDEKDPKFNTETRWMNSNFKWNSIPALTEFEHDISLPGNTVKGKWYNDEKPVCLPSLI